MRLFDHPEGRFRFLEGIAPYSSGVVATSGHELVRGVFHRPLPYRQGFDTIRQYLESRGEAMRSLAAVELRSPAAMSFDGFATFNDGYAETLYKHDLLVEAGNPLARTNVVPLGYECLEPCLYAFSYATTSELTSPTFVVAGAAELRADALTETAIVRPGDTSPEGLREKARHVLETMSKRLTGLQASWASVTALDVYCAHEVRHAASVLQEAAGKGAVHGLRWFVSTPPVEGLDFELDARGVRRELVL